MGVDIRDKLLVGVSYDEIEEWLENKAEELNGAGEGDAFGYSTTCVIEEYFDYISPYYDSEKEVWFVGFSVPNHQSVSTDLFAVIEETAINFEKLTGLLPRLKGGAHVY